MTDTVEDDTPAQEPKHEPKHEPVPEQTSAAEPTDAERIQALFTRSPVEGQGAGEFHFAKWTRPLAVTVFGTDEAGAKAVRKGFAQAATAADLGIAEEDPEFGANVLVFFCERWGELTQVPGLDRLVPDLSKLCAILGATGANQYRIFSFDEAGGIRLAIVLLRYDDDLQRLSPDTLALSQAAQTLLLWSDQAFTAESPVIRRRHGPKIENWYAALLSAAYDERIPPSSRDPEIAGDLASFLEAIRAEEKSRRGRRRNGRGGAAGDDGAEATAEEESADATVAVDAQAEMAQEPPEETPPTSPVEVPQKAPSEGPLDTPQEAPQEMPGEGQPTAPQEIPPETQGEVSQDGAIGDASATPGDLTPGDLTPGDLTPGDLTPEDPTRS